MVRGIVLGMVAALLVVPAAGAADAAEIASYVAGHPVRVACDADVNKSPFAVAPGYTVAAWTLTGGDTIHAMPSVCEYAHAQLGSLNFAKGLQIFIHEAARARGRTGDSCPQMVADIGVYDVLRHFYGVQFFTPMSRMVGEQIIALTRTLPPSYQPELCWSVGHF